MKNRRSLRKDRGLKILLDTSFLLPTLGVGVEEEVYKVMGQLRGIELYYLEEGLLEALWVVLRYLNKIPMNVIEEGVELIRRDYELIKPSGKAITEAVKIYRLGHRDYIDALHYTTALHQGVKWLTLDRKFIGFLKEHNYVVEDVIITPSNILGSS